MLAGVCLLVVCLLLGIVQTRLTGLLILWSGLGVGVALALTPATFLIRRLARPSDLQVLMAAQMSLANGCLLVAFRWPGGWAWNWASLQPLPSWRHSVHALSLHSQDCGPRVSRPSNRAGRLSRLNCPRRGTLRYQRSISNRYPRDGFRQTHWPCAFPRRGASRETPIPRSAWRRHPTQS